jgi:tubulin---tyrosine ligase
VPIDLIDSAASLPSPETPLLQYTAYESLDFDHALKHQRSSLICAYVIRKALIRKHYLSNTISAWLVKHPESCLNSHFKPAVHFELDFAEFLDEALVDAWDLNESLDRNQGIEEESEREWWILKPGMSDGGNGIRLFSSFDELQTLFEEWESKGDDEDEEEEKEEEGDATNETNGTMASQLRHFIAQPYIHPPLLLKAQDDRKFHIRVYVLAVGSLKIYVYREMLALFAAKPYLAPGTSKIHPNADLTAHLTNTCFQDESTRENTVHRFWALEEKADAGMSWKQEVYEQICDITGEVFEAASREQMVHFQTLPNAFEVFGVDFLVDAEANAWLLELNAYPDFQQTGIDLQNLVIGGLFEDVVDVAVTPFFEIHPSGQAADRMTLVREIELGRR